MANINDDLNDVVFGEPSKFEFHGELSKAARDYFIKVLRRKDLSTLPVFFVSALISAFFITGFFDGFGSKFQIYMTTISPLLVAVSYFLDAIFINKKLVMKKILITDDTIVAKVGKLCISQGLDKVKNVIDFGDFYHIQISGFPYFVCQKDLIVRGTLEEFEVFFADFLVKNENNTKERM